MNKFEYYKSWDLSIEKLNDLGEKGWELIGISSPNTNNILYVFKRQLI